MKKVMLFIGRFQPPVSHHAKVYDYLENEFSDFEIYFSSSDKVDGLKSPFNFDEKQLIAEELGIPGDRFLYSAQLLRKEDYDRYFDDYKTALFIVSGAKDSGRIPLDNIDPESGLNMKKRRPGEATYFQKASTFKSDPRPMNQRGYVLYIPNIEDEYGIAEGSKFKKDLINSSDIEHAKKIYVNEYGRYNEEVFNLVYTKIKEAASREIKEAANRKTKSKRLNESRRLKELAGLAPLMEKSSKPIELEPEPKADPSSLVFKKPNNNSTYTIANHFDNDNINNQDVRESVFSQALSHYPLELLNEIVGRFDLKDQNTLAVHDKLSSIMDILRDNQKSSSFHGDETKGADWSGVNEQGINFVTEVVSTAARNMDLELPKIQQNNNYDAFEKDEDEMEDKLDLSNIKEQFGFFLDKKCINESNEYDDYKIPGFHISDAGYDANDIEFMRYDPDETKKKSWAKHRSILHDVSHFTDINDPNVKHELFGELIMRHPALLVNEIKQQLVGRKDDERPVNLYNKLFHIEKKLLNNNNDMDDLTAEEQQVVVDVTNAAIRDMELFFYYAGKKHRGQTVEDVVNWWIKYGEGYSDETSFDKAYDQIMNDFYLLKKRNREAAERKKVRDMQKAQEEEQLNTGPATTGL